MFYHFFKSFSDASKCNLNIKAEGQNEHHKIEAIFKAFAKAIKMAVKRDVNKMVLPSTKGLFVTESRVRNQEPRVAILILDS
jgi:imidazoleglycerol-phosphate dehydratase/histidinol-phosphatase